MKRNVYILTLILLFSLVLMMPGYSVSEYGVICDETDCLWSEELERLGNEVLPALTETYDIDMRVDILTDISGYNNDLSKAAADIYENQGYGGIYGSNGVTLTLLVRIDENGVSLDGWHPYAAGESDELTNHATWNICRNADTWLSEEAWAGDLAQDIEALTGAVNDMAEGLESFVLAGGVHSTIWSPLSGQLVAEEMRDTAAPPTDKPDHNNAAPANGTPYPGSTLPVDTGDGEAKPMRFAVMVLPALLVAAFVTYVLISKKKSAAATQAREQHAVSSGDIGRKS